MRLNSTPVGRVVFVVSFVALLLALCPSAAFAVWGQDWGTMEWGAAAPPVPTLPTWGLALLTILLLGAAMRFLKRGTLKCSATGVVMLLVLFSLTAMAAFNVTHTFSNGTIADADEVNANFTDIAAELAAKGGSLTVPNTFVNGNTAEAAEMNANFTAVASAISAAGGSVTLAHTFSDATTADATEVNDNFTAVEASLDAMPPEGMVQVPAGTYTMGFTGVATPEHPVTLGSFYLSEHETTYQLWYDVKTLASGMGYTFANDGREGQDGTIGAAPTGASGEPVTTVSWRDAIVWCNARSQQAGLTPAYTYSSATIKDATDATACDNAVFNPSANGYRLPTEAEWEYASRYQDGASWTPGDYASGATDVYLNDAACQVVAWFDSNSALATHEVGQKAVNQVGAYDMSGNVWEWCWDWYDTYGSGADTDPVGPASSPFGARVLRGGSWSHGTNLLRCASRLYNGPSPADVNGGFRCARGL